MTPMSIQSLTPEPPVARMAALLSQLLIARASSFILERWPLASGSVLAYDWSSRNRKQALFCRLISCVYGIGGRLQGRGRRRDGSEAINREGAGDVKDAARKS